VAVRAQEEAGSPHLPIVIKVLSSASFQISKIKKSLGSQASHPLTIRSINPQPEAPNACTLWRRCSDPRQAESGTLRGHKWGPLQGGILGLRAGTMLQSKDGHCADPRHIRLDPGLARVPMGHCRPSRLGTGITYTAIGRGSARPPVCCAPCGGYVDTLVGRESLAGWGLGVAPMTVSGGPSGSRFPPNPPLPPLPPPRGAPLPRGAPRPPGDPPAAHTISLRRRGNESVQEAQERQQNQDCHRKRVRVLWVVKSSTRRWGSVWDKVEREWSPTPVLPAIAPGHRQYLCVTD